MDEKKFITPEYVTAIQIKNMRRELDLTQKEFAALIHVSKPTVERWEMSKEPINGPIVLLLELFRKNKNYIKEIQLPDKIYPLRLFYMHQQTPCTVIDVDEINKRVFIKNFTDNVLFTAFGKEKNPDFSSYEEFLKSRCFPESRDKLKLALRELDLPFYDPFMIIEKTEGRMAEDDFWLKIER